MKKKVLLIEDDPAIVQAVSLTLDELEFVVEHFANGREGLESAIDNDFDLMIVDLILPEINGYDICRQVRVKRPLLPILMLTARNDELDVVLGLEHGADDYLTKPFRVRELLARVRALLRRSEAERSEQLHRVSATAGDPEVLELGALRVDVGPRIVSVNGEPIELTQLEFELVLFLARHEGKAVDREYILESVWGYKGGAYDVTVNSQLSKLRKKLGPAGDYLETIRGYGYRFRVGAVAGDFTEN